MTAFAGSTKSSTGLNSNLAASLAYLLGCISGILFLAIEHEDTYVRFHAMQSMLTFLAALVLTMIAGSFPVVGGVLRFGLAAATAVAWAVLIYKAFTGERYKLPYIGEMAERQIQ
jgi:uncharacterized membrane protein